MNLSLTGQTTPEINQHNRTARRSGKRIAYLIGTFPLLTTTFIDREILEAQRRGVDPVLIAIRRPTPFQMSAEVEQLAEKTTYLLPVHWFKFLVDNLYFGLTRPGRYFGTFFYLLSRPYHSLQGRLKTLLHFGEGVQAAGLLRPAGVAHIHAHFADRAAVIALVAARLLNITYSLTAHANDIYVSPVLLPEKVTNAKFVTTCTGYNKVHLEQVTGCAVELIYHGLDLTSLPAPAARLRSDQPPLILSVGQLKEKKGFAYLINACRLLHSQGYHFRCEIIGEGPDRAKLEQLINQLGLSKMVTLCGALPNVEVMSRYRQATIFALPCIIASTADRDGIPNVLLEAMANGLPVVSTQLSGIPEVIEDGVTGLLVRSEDENSLAKAMARLLDEPQLREKLAQQARQRIEERFDIRTNIGRLIELLEA